MVLPFLGSDSRYSMVAEEVRQLPLNRRLGVISISPREVALAFLGRDAAWAGGMSLAIGDTVHRGGLTLTLVAVGKNRLGRPTAELEVIACPGAVVTPTVTPAASSPRSADPTHAADAVPVPVQQSPA